MTTLRVFRLHLSVLLPCEWWGRRFLNHSNIEAVPNKRQPGDSPRTTKQQQLNPVDKSTYTCLCVIPHSQAINRSRRNALHRLPTAVSRSKQLWRPLLTGGWQIFSNGKHWKYFSKLFHITRRRRLVFWLNDCIFPKDLTQFLSG